MIIVLELGRHLESTISLVEGVLAVSAIAAAIFAGLTLRQARKFNLEESRSRRAYLTPSDHPGFLKKQDALSLEPSLQIDFLNSGVNPCHHVRGLLVAFVKSEDGIGNVYYEGLFREEHFANNPIPKSGHWLVQVSRQTFQSGGISEMSIILSGFILFKVRYSDRVLRDTYEDTFLWRRSAEGELVEVQPPDYDNLLKNAQEFDFTQI